MKVSVVILNFNGIALMDKYLPSVIRSIEGREGWELVIADNGSTDGSVDWLRNHHPAIRLIAMDRNWGFAEGYNRAIAEVEADYIVLLNSDVETPDGWLEPLVEYMDSHDRCAACQPKIIAEQRRTHFEYAGAAGGFIDKYGYPFCRGRILDNVEEDHGQYNTNIEIFWATGACLMIRRNIYIETGGLDARFFAHQEEIDLCWRIKARGWSIACIGNSEVYHLGGGSLGYESPRKTYLNFRNNQLMLYKNLDGPEYAWVLTMRFFLDIAAALHLLAQGKTANCKAVFEAWRDFIKTKKSFKASKTENITHRTTKNIEGRLNFLLILKVYISKRKTFAELMRK